MKPTSELATLYSQFIAQQGEGFQACCAEVCRERARSLNRLRKQGVVTVADLLERLASLSPSLRQSCIQLISLLEIRLAVPALLELMYDRKVRIDCASAISFLKPDRSAIRRFIEIARRELASTPPDRFWLEAVVHGLGNSDDQASTDVLVAIFERRDLPGWLRGDAADKLGCCAHIRDRRSKLFRRCRETALAGLTDKSIEVQFGSMYLIGSLCQLYHSQRKTNLRDFALAMPTLRKIATKDHRLAPGFWWPMSAEAEDVIACIQTGSWPSDDAAERWFGNTERGEWNRD